MNGEVYPETHSPRKHFISSLNMTGVNTDTAMEQSSKVTEFSNNC